MKIFLFSIYFLFCSFLLFSQTSYNRVSNLDYSIKFGYIFPLSLEQNTFPINPPVNSVNIGINYKPFMYYKIGMNIGFVFSVDPAFPIVITGFPLEIVNTFLIKEFQPSISIGSDSIKSLNYLNISFYNIYIKYHIEYVHPIKNFFSIVFGLSIKNNFYFFKNEISDVKTQFPYFTNLSFILSTGYLWH
jgi:hypothetical protein